MGRRYKQGTARTQYALLPPRIEDYISRDNAVRAIDAYVDTLDLKKLGFQNTGGGVTAGQPAFDPAVLLKLYVVGYINRVHSSRRLARECRRNLEVIWLLEGLTPGYRTIAEFRKVNGPGLKAACKDFVSLCKELELLGGEEVAVDGSFFNANASDASITTKKQIEKDLKQIESDIDAYYQKLDLQDEQESGNGDQLGEETALDEKLEQLKARQARKKAQLKHLEESGEIQLSRTDPDARALSKAGKHLTGYNVQSVVDDKHKLIVHHEVTNAGNDQGQLAAQGNAAKEVLGVDTLTVLGDAGYYSEEQLAACEESNLRVFVPIPDKHKAVASGQRLTGERFHYVPDADVYVCPGGQLLRPQGKPTLKHGTLRTRYTSAARQCKGCVLKAACLPKKTARRQIYRSEHAMLVESHRRRMAEEGRERMRQRAAMVEHPFGTLKRWFGWDHFLVRGFKKVSGEMSLMVLGYNLTRVIHILGIQGFVDYCARHFPPIYQATPDKMMA